MRVELQQFAKVWEREASGTLALLRAIPADAYDFRPDPGGRSIGELAWHLAEVDAYVSLGVELGEFKFNAKPPNLERPRTVDALAPAYRIVHDDAVARIGWLRDTDLNREIKYADGRAWTVRNLLWEKLLLHHVHHRGQLMLLCRLAGGVPPALFGRRREETPRDKPIAEMARLTSGDVRETPATRVATLDRGGSARRRGRDDPHRLRDSAV